MKNNSLKLLKTILGVAIGVATLISCNGGSTATTYGGQSNPGNFEMILDSPLVVDGSESLIITLKNSYNISNPTDIKVTNSDNGVINVSQDSCTGNKQMAQFPSTCSLFLKGVSTGLSTITLSADGYPTTTKTISVNKDWGIVGGNFYTTIGKLSVTNDNIYIMLNRPPESQLSNVYFSKNGNQWLLVANSPAFKNVEAPINCDISSNESYVCLATDGVMDHIDQAIISCSKNNESWYQFPILTSAEPDAISLYNGNIYMEASGDLNTNVQYCSIENCNEWQQLGSIFPTMGLHNVKNVGIFNTTAFVEHESMVYFLNSNESWELYGTYPAAASAGYFYSSLGLFVMPEYNVPIPFNQSIFYGSESNLGESLSTIGEILTASTPSDSFPYPAFTQIGNTVYASLLNGKIYSSTYSDGIWSSWAVVGNSSVPLGAIYSTPDGTKLYSIYTDDKGHGQVYVYSLQ